jgi:hypothetical protein
LELDLRPLGLATAKGMAALAAQAAAKILMTRLEMLLILTLENFSVQWCGHGVGWDSRVVLALQAVPVLEALLLPELLALMLEQEPELALELGSERALALESAVMMVLAFSWWPVLEVLPLVPDFSRQCQRRWVRDSGSMAEEVGPSCQRRFREEFLSVHPLFCTLEADQEEHEDGDAMQTRLPQQ